MAIEFTEVARDIQYHYENDKGQHFSLTIKHDLTKPKFKRWGAALFLVNDYSLICTFKEMTSESGCIKAAKMAIEKMAAKEAV